MSTSTSIDITALQKGQEVAADRYEISRDTLVRYAGASGDFNAIHYNDQVARDVGLDGVIAHGMLTMGTAVTVVSEWIGDPAAVTAYATRFSQPVPVPATGTVVLEVRAVVAAVDLSAGTVQLTLEAQVDGAAVLSRAKVTARIPQDET